MTITMADFLEARLQEGVDHLKTLTNDSLALISYTNMVSNMRVALEWHKNFPILFEGKPEFDVKEGVDGINDLRYTMSQEIEWLTTEEYRKKFGDEPPTSPLLTAWVQQYAWHPDFQTEWLIDD